MLKLEDKRYNSNLIYYYYKDAEESLKAFKDLANPVVLSIATFRKWNKTTMIHVLDSSRIPQDWGDWPERLQFRVYRYDQLGNETFKNGRDKFCYGMLSKPSVIFRHVRENIQHHSTVIVCDSDVFFVQNPFPLAVDHTRGICCSLENVGYWYFMNGGYDGEMNDAHKILELWSGLCAGAFINPHFKARLAERCKWDETIVQEEAVFWYLQKVCPDLLIKDIPYTENFWFDWPGEVYDTRKVKNLHYRVWRTHGKMKRSERGKLCLHVKELRKILLDMLSPPEIHELYDGWITKDVFSMHDAATVNEFLGPF